MKRKIRGTEHDRSTRAYREANPDAVSPAVEAAAGLIFDAGYRGTADRRCWVPTAELIGAVQSQFPQAPALTAREWGIAIRTAEPDAVRVLRRYMGFAKPAWGWAGITGPNSTQSKAVTL